jgi:putative ABC transport system permease protein
MDELRLANRRLTKRPGATVVSIVTLACAIGAAAATWSLLSAVLLRPLPVKDADRLVVAGTVNAAGPFTAAGTVRDGFIYPLFPVFRDSGIFERVAAEWSSPESLLTSTDGLPVRTPIGFATFDFFDLLGLRIPVGRGFTSDDDRRGATPVAILTDRYWRRTFDARTDVIGRTITIQGKAVTIVGVAQPGFRGLDLSQTVDVYLPLHTIGDMGSALTNYFAEAGHSSAPTSGTRIVARLRNDTSLAQTMSRLAALDPPAWQGARVKPVLALTPINLSAIPFNARAGMAQFARLLGATVALLLLIGCGTVGMLLLIRTEARREELAVCVALGASRARLARGIAIEGALLSGAGAVCAVPVAWWLFKGVGAFQLPGGIDIGGLNLGLDTRALAASAAGALLASVAISLIAGTFGLTASAAESLRSCGGATARMTRRHTRAALVTTQVAVAMVLVAGAGLFARSLAAALSLNTGLDMGRMVTGSIYLGPYGYNVPRATAFFDDLRARLSANAAVKSVAYSASQGGMGGKLAVDSVPRQFPSAVWFTAVDEDYFRTMGIHVTAGRDFTGGDRPGAPLVTIVSESFGRRLADGGNPIGRRVTMPMHRVGSPPDVMEVVGVVEDIVTRVSVLEPLDMYFPVRQTDPSLNRTIAVRAAGDGDAARREIMSAIKAADPAVAPSPLLTLEERIGQQMAAQRFGALVLGTLGAIAVLLTILGTYVLGESMAVMRMREMGIRAALGATRRQLGAIVVVETGRLVGLGLIVGLGIAWLGASTIRSFLFQIQPFDPLTLAGVAGSILTLALLVSLRPALRAARVDLGRVLKEQ